MQIVQFKVNDNSLQIVLTLLNNLKKGIVHDISVVKNSEIDDYKDWNNDELLQVGKIGFDSKSFVDDEEDYSKW